ncbi:MAG: pseudouridine synthase [Thermoprotei archaeon]|nr:MAG: pseudouridine synthase [Thermoprotei archaeon]
MIREAQEEELRCLRAIANHQFRADIGEKLFPRGVLLKISKRTGRPREVLTSSGEVIVTLRPSTFTFNLTLYSGRIIHACTEPPKLRVVVVNEVANDVKLGGSVFARHILRVDEELRAGDEVIIVDEDDRFLCVGRLVLSPYEIMHFIRGPAAKLRECV